MKEFLSELGLRLPDIVAAFWGGVASAFFVRNVTPWQALSTFVIGLVLGSYFGAPAAKLTGLATETASCLVAFAGMAVAQGLTKAVRAWKPTIPGGKP